MYSLYFGLLLKCYLFGKKKKKGSPVSFSCLNEVKEKFTLIGIWHFGRVIGFRGHPSDEFTDLFLGV
jgi:hypothetical protein